MQLEMGAGAGHWVGAAATEELGVLVPAEGLQTEGPFFHAQHPEAVKNHPRVKRWVTQGLVVG